MATNREHVSCNIIAVGDSRCGKTSLLTAFYAKEFRNLKYFFICSYEQFSFDLNSKVIQITLHDTPSQPEFEFERSLIYDNQDAILICYDVSNKTSFNNLFSVWREELQDHVKKVKIVVGLKDDLLDPIADEHVSYAEAKRTARRLGAIACFTCSSKTYVATRGEKGNVDKVFSKAMRAVLELKGEHRYGCTKYTCCLF